MGGERDAVSDSASSTEGTQTVVEEPDDETRTVAEESAADTEADYRIAPELKRDLSAARHNDRAEFAFIKQMDSVSDDIALVTFELPFGEETFTQRFRRPGAPETYALPSLEDLYEAAEAEMDRPSTILETSVPLEVAEGHTVDHPEDAVNVDVDWLPADVTLLPDREIGVLARWIPRLLSLATLFGTYAVWTRVGWVLGTVFGLVGLFVVLLVVTSRDKYPPPPGAESLSSLRDLDEGAVVVLDDTPVYDRDNRQILRVVGHVDDRVEATRPDGTVAELATEDDDYRLTVGDLEETYEEAHRLPLTT
jgi:hypothetical protein